MKLSELASKIGLTAINQYKDQEFTGVYVSDMVSDIITGAKAHSLLITLQTHKSLIAAANLVDVAAVIFTKGKKPATDVVELADKAHIGLFCTELNTWALASKLSEIGIK